jgi:uncharacterized membrane protein YagU involved in acid resistance
MRRITFSTPAAIIVGGLIAGVLDIAAVFAFWAVRDVPPTTILQSIASSVLGGDAFTLGMVATAIGLLLHFAVSLVFAAAYVIASARVRLLRLRPIPLGIAYGALAYVIMTFVVVPLSRAEFGQTWPPPLVNLAASVFIHLFLFGLPIALCASRIEGTASQGVASPTVDSTG